MRVNRLGGTTLDYVVKFMAEKEGLISEERDITLADINAGKYSVIGMAGNAVELKPFREIRYYDGDRLVDGKELFPKGEVPEVMQRLMRRYFDETRGRIDPSHPSLLTPVNVVAGQILREKLDFHYSSDSLTYVTRK